MEHSAALLLLELPSWPTAALAFVVAVFTALKGIELYQGKSKNRLVEERDHWKNNCAAAEKASELALADKDRLIADKAALNHDKGLLEQEVMRLKTQTDLKPLLDGQQKWIEEGRTRFDQSMQELTKTRDVLALGQRELFAEMKSQRDTFEAGFRVYTSEFMKHVGEDHETWKSLLGMIRVMESRLNHVAVHIGMVKWPDENTPIERGKPEGQSGTPQPDAKRRPHAQKQP